MIYYCIVHKICMYHIITILSTLLRISISYGVQVPRKLVNSVVGPRSLEIMLRAFLLELRYCMYHN